MARKPWNSLSQGYKDRLSKGGITPSMHAAGDSIRKARGHETTPERPKQGLTRQNDFAEWFLRREDMVKKIVARKRALFGSSPSFNASKSATAVSEGSVEGNPPSMAKLQWAIDADDRDWYDALSSGDEDFSFLRYH